MSKGERGIREPAGVNAANAGARKKRRTAIGAAALVATGALGVRVAKEMGRRNKDAAADMQSRERDAAFDLQRERELEAMRLGIDAGGKGQQRKPVKQNPPRAPRSEQAKNAEHAQNSEPKKLDAREERAKAFVELFKKDLEGLLRRKIEDGYTEEEYGNLGSGDIYAFCMRGYCDIKRVVKLKDGNSYITDDNLILRIVGFQNDPSSCMVYVGSHFFLDEDNRGNYFSFFGTAEAVRKKLPQLISWQEDYDSALDKNLSFDQQIQRLEDLKNKWRNKLSEDALKGIDNEIAAVKFKNTP